MANYLKQVALAVDQLANALLFGMADETLSARFYRNRFENSNYMLGYKFINMLFFWQSDHCKEAFESEIKRKHLPREYKNL